VTRHTLRHPLRGSRRYAKPATRPRRVRTARVHQPRIRPRRQVHVADLVSSPEDEPSRPMLRIQIVGLIVLTLFGILVLRLWSLTVINHSNYAAAVTTNEVRDVTVPPPRGLIVDRNGTELTSNVVEEQIVLSRAEAAQHPEVIGAVANLVGQSPRSVEQALDDTQYSPYEPVPVLNDADMATVEFLEEHASEYPGVSVQQVTERTYPQNAASGTDVASQVLGYVSPISAAELKAHPGAGYTQASQYGQTGLENQYESYLKGSPGQKAVAVNAQGEVEGTLHQTNPTQGDTVVTNVDLGLQEEVQAALQNDITNDRKTVDSSTGRYPAATDGAVVVMNAHTGAVLAMASYPTYDLSEWVGGISQAAYDGLTSSCSTTTQSCPLDNNAIQGLYTPGSTFKLATATAALQTGIIGADTYVDDTGTFTVRGCTGAEAGCSFHDAEAGDAGEVDLPDALTESDDYYFYNLGDLFYEDQAQYGPSPVQNVAHDYGLGDLTGIDLPNEVQGQVDSQAEREMLHQEDPSAFPNTSWYVGDNIEMAFGQGGTVVTPIEEADAYATFANGGTRYQPQVAADIVSPTGQLIKRITPKVTGTVSLPSSVEQPIMQGLLGVVNSASGPQGTAYQTFQQYAHFPELTFPVAGKTGTADVTSGEPNAWFVGFGPTNAAASEPEYVVVAVVGQGGYGAQAAAPAVATIFNYLYANPVQPVKVPTAADPPSATPPAALPPAGSAPAPHGF
jgi:penicillin-binding protein 2